MRGPHTSPETIFQSLVVLESSGGFRHSLAQVTPEEAGDGDVLCEDIQAAAVSASPDTQGLCSEGAEACICTTLAPTSAIAMDECFTPVLAKDTVWVSAHAPARDCLALCRHMASPWVEVSAMWSTCSAFLTYCIGGLRIEGWEVNDGRVSLCDCTIFNGCLGVFGLLLGGRVNCMAFTSLSPFGMS